jgi:small-conductance mechanosensitive channel
MAKVFQLRSLYPGDVPGGQSLAGRIPVPATDLGLLSAGLAIALKDLIMNLAGWLFIIWRRPFEVGDRIQIGNHAGDVIDQRIFQFTILEIGNWVDADQGTGRTIHIPNGKVFGEAQANYTKGFPYIWNEIAVLITFESNWKKAKNLLQEIDTQRAESFVEAAEQKLRKASRTVVIPQSGLTPMVSTSVKESGVRLTLRYLFDPRRRRESTNLLWEDILEAFGLCSDVAFAYPTQRFYDNLAEGKQGAQKLRIPVEKNTSLRDGS